MVEPQKVTGDYALVEYEGAIAEFASIVAEIHTASSSMMAYENLIWNLEDEASIKKNAKHFEKLQKNTEQIRLKNYSNFHESALVVSVLIIKSERILPIFSDQLNITSHIVSARLFHKTLVDLRRNIEIAHLISDFGRCQNPAYDSNYRKYIFPVSNTLFKNVFERIEFFLSRIKEILSSGENYDIVYVNLFVSTFNETKKKTNERRSTAAEFVDDESKLDIAALAPIFEGTLEHEFLANSLRWVMEQEKLSVRKVASKSGSSLSVIQTVLNGKAKLETGQKVLEALGYGVNASLHKLEP